MNDSKSSKLPWLITIFSLIGLVLAGTSIYVHLQVEYGLLEGPSFCTLSKDIDCETVYRSKWASFFGISLGAYGFPYYILMIFFAFFAKESKRFSQTALLLTSISCLFSLYLFLISKLVIGSLCLICMGMYGVSFALFGLFVWLVRSDPRDPDKTYLQYLGSKQSLIAFFVSIAAFLLAAAVPPKIAEARFNELIGEVVLLAVDEWKTLPVDDLGLSFEGGADKDYLDGSKDAPIQVVEYIDYQCPFCRRLFFDLQVLKAEFGEDKVSSVVKHFPLDSSCNDQMPGPMHDHACYASEVARCAGEQGAFTEMTSALLSMPELEQESSLEDVRFAVVSAVSSIGLDKSALEECLESDRQLEAIKRDVKKAGALGLEATPSVWINGRQVSLVSPETLRAVFKYILNEENS